MIERFQQGKHILLPALPKQDFSPSCITPPGLLEGTSAPLSRI